MLGKNGINKIFMKRIMHTLVSFMLVITAMWALILPYTVPERHLNHKVMLHVWPHRWYLFTLWAAVIQFIYFGLNTAIDIVEIYGERSPYYRLRESLHSVASYLLFTLVFPVSLQETILFWSFYFWDREAIYPIALDDFIPSLFNHILHTFPVPLTIVYMLMTNEKVPPLAVTLPGLMAFQAIYAYFILNLRITKGIWVYAALEILELRNEMLLKIIMTLTFTGPVLFLLLGYKLNSLTNG